MTASASVHTAAADSGGEVLRPHAENVFADELKALAAADAAAEAAVAR